jgi:hypothetical protein
LNNRAITIAGQRFIGGTLWFVNDPCGVAYQHLMSDFLPDTRVYKLGLPGQ